MVAGSPHFIEDAAVKYSQREKPIPSLQVQLAPQPPCPTLSSLRLAYRNSAALNYSWRYLSLSEAASRMK